MTSFYSVLSFFQLTKFFPELWYSLFAYMSHLASTFQVREVRTYLFNAIVACLAIVSRFLSLCVTVNA